MDLNQQIQKAAELIANAHNIVALTGAGISTPSGIPDFRSPDSGVWEKSNPMKVASIYGFRQNPQDFYDWIRPLADLLFKAEPNPAHRALARLEQQGKLKTVITQNIDNLHQKAGSNIVFELHGHLRAFTCLKCQQNEEAGSIINKFMQDGQTPIHHCGGVLKPDVILFGEELPMQEFVSAKLTLEQADLVIVTGSSLEVAPAAGLPSVALRHGAKLIIINDQPTYLDSQADIVIRGDVAEVLPQIVESVAG